MGRREEALDAVQEAVELYRKLANENPAESSPDLAASLNNMSKFLSELGHREEALDAVQKG